MNLEQLYVASLKMINDKYPNSNKNIYPKDKFTDLFNKTYLDNNQNPQNPSNDINKLILVSIKNELDDDIHKPIDIESKVKELESIRLNMNKLTPVIKSIDSSTTNDDDSSTILHKITPPPTIHINNHQDFIQHKYKSFIINSIKNNYKVNLPSSIDIKTNVIYPSSISIPSIIKTLTPYLLIYISDGFKNINYTYIPSIISTQGHWDIWNPITDEYIDINLNHNRWTISIIDFLQNPIDFNQFYCLILDVLANYHDNKEVFSINVENIHLFHINDRIKIINDDNGSIHDNQIIAIHDNRLILHKQFQNHLFKLDDFIHTSVFNYKYLYSIMFKYHPK